PPPPRPPTAAGAVTPRGRPAAPGPARPAGASRGWRARAPRSWAVILEAAREPAHGLARHRPAPVTRVVVPRDDFRAGLLDRRRQPARGDGAEVLQGRPVGGPRMAVAGPERFELRHHAGQLGIAVPARGRGGALRP